MKEAIIRDANIDPKIKEAVLDEDLLGTISKREDMARRGEQPDPNVEKPDGAASKPKPVSKTLKRGRNTENLTYDPETGRPISANGSLSEDFGGGVRKDNATAVGKLGDDGDHGGHLVGHRFMGDTPDAGIAPQAGNLNTGAWKTMENEWAAWIKKGYRVDYDIGVYPPGAVRPDSFDVSYKVIDPRTGAEKYVNKKELKNKAGQKFTRVPFKDMN